MADQPQTREVYEKGKGLHDKLAKLEELVGKSAPNVPVDVRIAARGELISYLDAERQRYGSSVPVTDANLGDAIKQYSDLMSTDVREYTFKNLEQAVAQLPEDRLEQLLADKKFRESAPEDARGVLESFIVYRTLEAAVKDYKEGHPVPKEINERILKVAAAAAHDKTMKRVAEVQKELGYSDPDRQKALAAFEASSVLKGALNQDGVYKLAEEGLQTELETIREQYGKNFEKVYEAARNTVKTNLEAAKETDKFTAAARSLLYQ